MHWPLLLVPSAGAIQLQQSQLAALEVVEELWLEAATGAMLLLLIQLRMALEEGGSRAMAVMAGIVLGQFRPFTVVSRS